MNPALVSLQARLGGALHRPTPETLALYGTTALFYRYKLEATQWLETGVKGRRAFVLVDLRRRVGPFGVDVADDEPAELRVRQAVAVVLPGVALASPLAPVDWPPAPIVPRRGLFSRRTMTPHLFLLDHPMPPYTWTLAGGEAPVLAAGSFRFAGCFHGVLYAVQEGPTLDVDAAARALDELADLAALPWRAPSPEAIAVWHAGVLRDQRRAMWVVVAFLVAFAMLSLALSYAFA
ncbi:uncharacterized protein SOCEGT47_017710 [Sorangium cellulosum]|uniref:Uncharacterized protein n=1 Tax=Sorangium cellulosum TaxID=56 RepID=A0A4P2PX31_SORCE|nr:hypothetical protein [Sorangium cellulosum]AUX21290.1 uncharacterized protein SOCEGT47_017710 [Sorangium cellulosum]